MSNSTRKENPWWTAGKGVAEEEYNILKARGVQSPYRRNFLAKAAEGLQIAAIGTLLVITHLDKFEKLFAWLETLSLSDSQKQLLGVLKNIPPDQLDREYVLHDLTVGKDGAYVRRSPFAPLDNKSGENAAVARLKKDAVVPKVVKVHGKSPDVPGKPGIWYAILDYQPTPQGDQLNNVAFTYEDNLVISVAERPTAGNKKTITLNP